jgi:hypothetical protein
VPVAAVFGQQRGFVGDLDIERINKQNPIALARIITAPAYVIAQELRLGNAGFLSVAAWGRGRVIRMTWRSIMAQWRV